MPSASTLGLLRADDVAVHALEHGGLAQGATHADRTVGIEQARRTALLRGAEPVVLDRGLDRGVVAGEHFDRIAKDDTQQH